MKQEMKMWIRDVAIILFVFSIGIFFGFFIQKEVQKHSTIQIDTLQEDTSNTEQYIKAKLEKHKVRFSHIVLAQAILESANFTSKLAMENKNLFGMKVPAQRFTFATNYFDYGNYAKYESIEECIMDYKCWQMQNAYNITTEEGYFNLLHSIYAEDPDYIQKLKKFSR